MTTDFFSEEISQQPAALGSLIEFYQTEAGMGLLQQSTLIDDVWLAGMGASFHAAHIAAIRLQMQGRCAQAVEAIDLFNLFLPALPERAPIVYISQSGASGEVALLADVLRRHRTISITNEPDSLLARVSTTVLPLMAGDEQTVATKTYINSLALLHLLSGGTLAELSLAQDRIQHLLTEDGSGHWMDILSGARHVYCLGHGIHAVTARQAAMMMGEWAKLPATPMGIGAFRHGFIEVVQPEDAVLIFAPPGPTQPSALALANELQGYGVRILHIAHGMTHRDDDLNVGSSLGLPEALAPLLDVIPVQLFVRAFVERSGIARGFRYIRKVTTTV